MILHFKQQRIYQWTLGTQELTIGSMTSLRPQGTLQGPSKGPCDFRGSLSQFLPFLQNTLSKSPLCSKDYGRFFCHCGALPGLR